MNHVKAILIDLDGTLVDSMPTLYRIYCQFLADYGIEGSKEEFNRLNGNRMKTAIDILIDSYQLPISFEEARLKYQQTLLEEYLSKVKLFPGVNSFLAKAKEMGLRMAVVSAANHDVVAQILKWHHIDQYFDAIVSAQGLPQGKPDPAIYVKALEILGVAPHEAIAIEDACNGIKAALGAKMTTWLFTGSSWDQEIDDSLLQKVTPVHSWKEIQEYLDDSF